MKKLFTVLLLGLALSTSAQQPLQFKYTIDVADTTILFNEAGIWLASTFDSKDSRIHWSDLESGVLIGVSDTEYVHENSNYSDFDGSINYNIRMDVGKEIVLTVFNFRHTSSNPRSSFGLIKNDEKQELIGPVYGSTRVFPDIKLVCERIARQLESSLKATISPNYDNRDIYNAIFK